LDTAISGDFGEHHSIRRSHTSPGQHFPKITSMAQRRTGGEVPCNRAVAQMKLDEIAAPHGSIIQVAQKRLLLVDDHPVFRHGLKQLLDDVRDVEICGEAETAQEALDAFRRLRPDGALLEVSLPGTNGIELIKLALAEHPKLAMLVISMHDESLYALRALRAGAKGYVMKREAPNLVVEAVRTVMAGGIYVSPNLSERLVFKAIYSSEGDLGSPIDRLSDRELEVLQLLGAGRSTRQIAETLYLSVKDDRNTSRSHQKEARLQRRRRDGQIRG
jgi:DNA-binding NarL/FixJ family response regulator